MNGVDKIIIISPSVCENSILFRHTPLLSEINPCYATRTQWTQSQPLFSSQDDLLQVKRGQIQSIIDSIR